MLGICVFLFAPLHTWTLAHKALNLCYTGRTFSYFVKTLVSFFGSHLGIFDLEQYSLSVDFIRHFGEKLWPLTMAMTVDTITGNQSLREAIIGPRCQSGRHSCYMPLRTPSSVWRSLMVSRIPEKLRKE